MNLPQQTARAVTAGQKWAANEATCDHLDRLNELYEQLRHEPIGWDSWFSDQPSGVHTTAERLFFVIEPEQHGDRSAAETFWECFEHAYDLDAEFVKAFAEGAIGLE